METLKRKSSDTYINAAKVSTNIINNSSSNNNIISSSSSLVVHTRGPVEMTPSVNSKSNEPQQSQQTSSASFYNDQKYLHKKFKRIASATIDTNYTNNNNNKNDNNQESLVKNLINRTKSPSATEVTGNSLVTLPVKLNENSSFIKVSNNNFSSANNSSHHSIINNNNLINNFKVVQNHTTPLATSNHLHSHKNVPQVMTAYENYIITEEKLTHHQVQQMNAAKINSSTPDSSYVNSNPNNNNKSSKKYENPPNNQIIHQEAFAPCTSSVTFLSSNKVQHEVYSSSSSNLNQQQSLTNDGQSTPGRYVCPFCQLVCTKPSVLEKHIRAHTNERPYPCNLCGFAFKTKSNLHKHFK